MRSTGRRWIPASAGMTNLVFNATSPDFSPMAKKKAVYRGIICVRSACYAQARERKTECNAGRMEFHGLGARRVVGKCDGGRISSDGGSVLLREVESRTHILKRLAGCFIDHRDPELI